MIPANLTIEELVNADKKRFCSNTMLQWTEIMIHKVSKIDPSSTIAIVSNFSNEMSLYRNCGPENIFSDETGVPHTVKYWSPHLERRSQPFPATEVASYSLNLSSW
mgnify:CR=1 FL=1